MAYILIIEDDKDFAASLELVLGIYDLQSLSASSAEEALGVLEQRQDEIRLVFMDIKLPGMDGISCLQKIHSQWPEIPCVVMTGFRDRERLDRASSAGAADILLKPFRMENFLNLAKKYL